MPELPEVETIVSDLRKLIMGMKIASVDFITDSVWRSQVPNPGLLENATIINLERKAKNILISLSNGWTLVIHLKMTGRLTFAKVGAPIAKHTHFIVRFKEGQLRFNDVRRFGYLDLVQTRMLTAVPYLASLGPDPLKISKKEFVRLIKSKNRMIKSLLLDQTVISGLGNIYSDEALFRARIHPKKISSRLADEKAGGLYDAVIKILKKAISARGSSVNDYVDGKGERGGYQDHFRVYSREDQPCPRCRHPIKRSRIGSRSCHYCANCQR
jgi:formamidopyrimidine-DNA glycosylase